MSPRQRRLRDLYAARYRIDAEIHRLAPDPRKQPREWVAQTIADAQAVLAELQNQENTQ